MKKIVILLTISSWLFADVAIVKKISGETKVKRNKEVLSLKVGDSLQDGDIIMSQSNSSIGITFDDGSRLSLGEEAIFVIKKFKVNPDKEKYDVDLNLKKGKAVFSSGKIGTLSPESVKFRIPEGIIGIRGTKFAVEVK